MNHDKVFALLVLSLLAVLFFSLSVAVVFAADGGSSASVPPAGVPAWVWFVVAVGLPAVGVVIERLQKLLTALRDVVAQGLKVRIEPGQNEAFLDAVESRQKKVCTACGPAALKKNGVVVGGAVVPLPLLLLLFLGLGGCTPTQQIAAADLSVCIVRRVAPALL